MLTPEITAIPLTERETNNILVSTQTHIKITVKNLGSVTPTLAKSPVY